MSLSPPAGGGPYSHWARGRGQRNTVTLPFLNASMPSTGKLAPSAFRPTGGGAKVLETLSLGWNLKYLSAGAHGLAYRATNVSEASHRQFFGSLSSYVVGSPQSAPQKVIIKVHRLDKFDDIAAARMECKMQAWLHSQETTFRGTQVRGSEVVPPVFYAGLLDGGRRMGMVFITVMGEAPGVVLREFLRRRSNELTGFEYALIERAILTLWLLGVVHADLHEENIFIDEKSEKVTIIDFGYALILPKAKATQVRAALNHGANTNTLWNDKKTGLRKYVNAIQGGRGYDWYNPEAKVARYFRTLVDDEDKTTLSANRAKAWGKGAGQKHQREPSKRQQELLRRLTVSRPGFATSTGGRHYVQNPKTGVWRLSPGAPRKGGRSKRQLMLDSLLTASGHSPRGRAYTKDTKGLWRLVKGPDGYAPRRKPYPFPKGVKSGIVLDRSGGKRYRYGHYDYTTRAGKAA
ncbi:Putative kinase family protein, partial [Klebsormidium nitens]